jgi:hypothetical protein
LLLITAPLNDHLVSNRTVELVTDGRRTPVRCRKLYAADERRPAEVSQGRRRDLHPMTGSGDRTGCGEVITLAPVIHVARRDHLAIAC